MNIPLLPSLLKVLGLHSPFVDRSTSFDFDSIWFSADQNEVKFISASNLWIFCRLSSTPSTVFYGDVFTLLYFKSINEMNISHFECSKFWKSNLSTLLIYSECEKKREKSQYCGWNSRAIDWKGDIPRNIYTYTLNQ